MKISGCWRWTKGGGGGLYWKGGFRLMVLCMRPLRGMLYLRLKIKYSMLLSFIFQQNFVVDVSNLEVFIPAVDVISRFFF